MGTPSFRALASRCVSLRPRRQIFSVLIDVGAWPGSVAMSSNSTTFPMSLVVDIEMFVTRSRIASTTTGTRCSRRELLGLLEGGGQLGRVGDTDRLAAEALGDLDVVDAVDAQLRAS